MLAELIRTHALEAAQAGDWADVAATMNAQTVEVRNQKSWTMADLIGLVGAQGAALVGGTIQAAGASNPIFASAWIALSVTGLQLHTDDRQQMIDGLAAAGSWPAELTAAVKAAGLTYTSLAVETVTAEQCESAWAAGQLAWAAQAALELIRTRRQTWDVLAAQIRSQIESGSLVDNAAVIAAVTTGLES